MSNQGSFTYSEHVLNQQRLVPGIYGDIDFSVVPERYLADDSGIERLPPRLKEYAERALKNPGYVESVRNYTMTGDTVADAYAALIPRYGFRRLVSMLDSACDDGIEAVPDAPEELVAFIHAMEVVPDWIDMDLVEKGALQERIPLANVSPFAIRGAFVATFMNKYTALPMTMTGTLSDSKSARRVLETASFFTSTAMPGALSRYGKGFKAAAKVRLMHSMVRFNIMQSGRWDADVYGIPIPQVDQMPAGLIGIFLLSFALLAKGHKEFTPEQQARVEMARYRCHLLGLPRALLGETPEEIVDLMMARTVSLKEEYDEDICGDLVLGTMNAELLDDLSLRGRVHRWMERGFSKYFFIRNFCEGKAARAERIGVTYRFPDKIATAAAIAVIVTTTNFYKYGMMIPFLRQPLDNLLVTRLARLLESYGHADFVTDASQYKLQASG